MLQKAMKQPLCLSIPEEKRDKYVRETWNCIHFSDLWNGKVVNMIAKTVAESDNGDGNYEDNR